MDTTTTHASARPSTTSGPDGPEPDAPNVRRLTVRGPCSIAAAAAVRFGHRLAGPEGPVVRLGFCLDDLDGHGVVALRQDGDVVEFTVAAGPVDAVVAQASRILSLDVDATEFAALGVSDPVLGARQALAPGLRPPLFSSAYEAAAWSVLSARRSAAQMTKVRERLGRAHGAVVDVDGIDVVAFPTPERLLAVERFEGIEPARLERLHGIAAAALDGRLDTARLRAMDPEEALVDLQRLAGIGPFYSALIVIRSLGHTDAFTTAEPRALAAVARAYGLAADASPAAFDAVADGWRPFRTWALFLFRATEGRATGTPTSAPGCAA